MFLTDDVRWGLKTALLFEWSQSIHIFYSDFLYHCQMSLGCSRVPSRSPHFLSCQASLGPSWPSQFPRPSLVLMTLRVLRRTSQALYRKSLSWDSLDVFLVIWLGLWVSGEEGHRIKVSFSSHHIQGTNYTHVCTVDVNLDHLTEVVFVRFLHYKVTLDPL